MTNVQDPDPVFEDSVENLVGIANERDDAHPRSLNYRRRRFRVFGYPAMISRNRASIDAALTWPNARLSSAALRRSSVARLVYSTLMRGGMF
jgi:hypothetical protein